MYAKMLHMISEQYLGKIIVLYHNGFSLDSNDQYISNDSETKETFIQACKDNRIDVIDIDNVWTEAFENKGVIPYGFVNTEFGRRWHMSLFGWFRDYLYILLGGS